MEEDEIFGGRSWYFWRGKVVSLVEGGER